MTRYIEIKTCAECPFIIDDDFNKDCLSTYYCGYGVGDRHIPNPYHKVMSWCELPILGPTVQDTPSKDIGHAEA